MTSIDLTPEQALLAGFLAARAWNYLKRLWLYRYEALPRSKLSNLFKTLGWWLRSAFTAFDQSVASVRYRGITLLEWL